GDAVLAFPGTLADADPQSDVRGLGAMLYALITDRWPLGSPAGGVTGTAAPLPTVGGLKPARRGPGGAPIEPRELRPEVPFEISAVAVRALEAKGGVRTAATVAHVLEQASVVDQKTDLIPVLRLGQRAAGAHGHSLADPEAEANGRSNRLMLIIAGLGLLAVLLLGLLGWWVANVVAGDGSGAPFDDKALGLTTSAAPPTDGSAPPAGVPVPAGEVSVFSPQGTADNVGSARLVLDNNPATVWPTDSYFQQFPALKSGLGLLVTLPAPSNLTGLWINSTSPGTEVEVRSAPAASSTLDQTRVIGSATLGNGVTQIPVESNQQSRYVLIWITALSSSGSQFQSTIADVGFTAAR
ncbi:MAG: peptidoglycan biosynthesis protein MviN, partial [Aldersonia sp.]|nr:peptidoglycan biosynthesis protein MviN [Aldersonia sp.]